MRTQLGWHTDGSLARPWAENPSYTTPDPQERWRNKCVLLGAADSWWFVTHKQKMNCFKTFYYGAYLKHFIMGNSLVVQWFGLWASTAGGKGLIPGWGTQIPQAARCGQFFFYILMSICVTAKLFFLFFILFSHFFYIFFCPLQK